MEFGVHLPLLGFGEEQFSLEHLLAYAQSASERGFRTICANDHLVFGRPWLDGPTALAAVISRAGDARLATTVSLPVVRGPVALAKALGAIDLLSAGRLTVGLGPGSFPPDFAAVGVPWEQRWHRLEESVHVLRALWGGSEEPFVGRYYSTEGITLEPRPAQPAGPPLWIGSWGSDAGLRRVARLGDGWLASAYNTTPSGFASSWSRLRDRLRAAGREPEGFPNGLASMFCYVTDDPHQVTHVLERVAPALHRPVDQARDRLLVGAPGECAETLAAYAAAGVQRVYLWPVADVLTQLEMLAERVLPRLLD
jgi:alkanesulfonate monooxygenase SsuD/methylene tetrahydromethanopterin reductase-like flavin-dependent oxidoreductase (luciferase family)